MKRTLTLTFLVALAAVVLTGCYTSTITTQNAPAGAVIEVSHTHLIYGLVSSDPPLNLKQICPNGVSKIETMATFGDGCLGALTLGIYTPTTSLITCSSGSSYLLGQDEAGALVQVLDVTEHVSRDTGL
jgi:hypothetical protein